MNKFKNVNRIQADTLENQNILSGVMSLGKNDYSASPLLQLDIKQPVYALILQEALRRGYTTKAVNNLHFEVLNGGQRIAIFSPNSPNMTMVVKKTTGNKVYTKNCLKLAGLPVPEGGTFNNYADAFQYFSTRQRPQAVKPRGGAGGAGVSTSIKDEAGFSKAWQKAFRNGGNVIVEDHIEGDEIRLIVADGKVVAAVCRIPAFVIGDGVRTIQQLVDEKNEQRRSNPLERIYPIKQFDYLHNQLELTLDHVPAAEEYVRLASVSNVGVGGEAVSLIDLIHPTFFELAERTFNALPQATQIGLDVIASDFRANAFADNAVIIEVNGDPAIGTPYFAAYGKPAFDIPAQLLDYAEAQHTSHQEVMAAKLARPVFQPAEPCEQTDDQTKPAGKVENANTLLLRQHAEKQGLLITEVAPDLTLLYKGRQRRMFFEAVPDNMDYSSWRACQDRYWTKQLLQNAGINTVEGKAFPIRLCKTAWNYAQNLTLPVMLRPRNTTSKFGFSIFASTKEEFYSGHKRLSAAGIQNYMAEERTDGKKYKLFMVDFALTAVSEMLMGYNVDRTAETHPDWAMIGRKVCQALYDMPFAGVNFVAEDIAKAPSEQVWNVTLVEANPDLAACHYPDHGTRFNVMDRLLSVAFER